MLIEADATLSDDILTMTTEDIALRTRLLDNECKMMRSGTVGIL